jgi:hypothetical protein
VAVPFNARAVFWLRSDRLYRVYCRTDAIRFIRIGGQSWGLVYGLESQGGSIGGALAKRVRAREHEKLRRAELEADAFDSEFLLSRHRHNLRILPHEVTEARILPPGPFVHGPHVGRWHITLGDKSRLRLQFETTHDLNLALEHLPSVLGNSLSAALDTAPEPPGGT